MSVQTKKHFISSFLVCKYYVSSLKTSVIIVVHRTQPYWKRTPCLTQILFLNTENVFTTFAMLKTIMSKKDYRNGSLLLIQIP